MKMQKVTPFLWFEKDAGEAGKYYASIFKNTRVVGSNPMVTTLDLEGMTVLIMNGGPTYKLNEAFSLSISCDTQEEIDYFWEKLSAGGSEGRCGWLKDKYGVSWQVIPSILPSLMSNPEKSKKVMAAFMKMNKFIIEELQNA
jgi:predicted 3-demethylubiquinone-9 3-methyltransferase (glyoxalase superfamily)